MSDFARALPVVLDIEGGYVNDPDDRGGATNLGVTQATFDKWSEMKGKPSRPVTEISKSEAADVYRDLYWHAARCEILPWPVSLAQFDAAVNHGVGRAAIMLQEALGVVADGIIGPKTLAAVESADPHELVERMLWERIAFYRLISKGSQLKFLRGWLARLLHLREAAA